jgi:hypothetical protein
MRILFCNIIFLLLFLCTIFFAQSGLVCAEPAPDSQTQITEQLSHSQRLSLAKDFVAKLKSGLSDADKWLYPEMYKNKKAGDETNVLDEGELLLLQPVLNSGFRPDGVITSQISKGGVVASLADFASILQLVINVDPDGQKAAGWYIRENRIFSLNMAKKEVVTPQGTYKISDRVFSEGGDIFVPVQELALWFGFEADVRVSYQEIRINSDEMMPVQEKEERKKKKYTGYEVSSPSLPLGGETYTSVSVPIVDVSTRSNYQKLDGDENGDRTNQATIQTAGDFAGGTLKTQSLVNDTNQLARARVTYEQDSLEGDLLGRFKAKHIELGDIRTAQTPIGGTVSQELGLRVTNTDPTRNFSRASTVISGNAIPGWDVELYRHTQFLGIIHVGDDGFYSFNDITLFSDNNFRLVFYGPQGERHEETVNVPFDRTLLSQGEGIYDISVSFDGQNAYVNRDLKSSDEDRGSMKLVAMYEKPITDGLTGSVGVHSEIQDSRRNYVGSVGLSWIQNEALVNTNVAVDNEGDGAAEFAVRRDFGNHEMNYTGEWRGANFDDDTRESDYDVDTFESSLSINGPLLLPFSNDLSARYNTGFVHEYESGGDTLTSSMLGLNMSYNNVSFYGDLRHKTGNILSDDTLNSAANLNIRKGANNLYLTGDYEIMPNAEFKKFSASYARDFTDKLEMGLSVSKNIDQSMTDYQARLDWQAGFIRISPSISYNSNDNFFAGVSTRFGLMREPISGDIRMYDKNISNNAFVSALVYLDKNGDGEYNKDDELLPDIIVSAPQNGRRATTNEKGIALFERMVDLRLTDVFVDKESLPDPAWIPGFEGVSILPRQGYVAKVEFPIHMSGELDGTVYANVASLFDKVPKDKQFDSAVAQIEPASGVAPQEGEEEAFDAALMEYKVEITKDNVISSDAAVNMQPVPLRNIELKLYNDKGEVEQKVTTDVDGFYYFTNIPPGRYFLMISEESAQRKNIIRPKPEPIEITYDGTLIYDHKIYVDTGKGDIPSEIISDLKEYKERHPHVHFDDEASDLVLNFGDFNSRLLMSLVWYKLRSQYGEILGEHTNPLVPPAESFANVKTGKHILRVGLAGKTIDEAYSICHGFIARDQYCKVEITSAYMNNEQIKLAKATIAPAMEIFSEGSVNQGIETAIATLDTVESDEETEVAIVLDEELIRQEEEAAIEASALDEELIRQIRARIEATAIAAATGKPINISAPSKMLIP